MTAAHELWARLQAAEKQEQATRDAAEAIGDPAPEWTPGYEAADQAARAAWVGAEGARHALDAFLHPGRYAEKGFRAEALDQFRARAEAEELEIEPTI